MTTTYALPIAITGIDAPLALTTIDRANFGPGVNSVVKNGGLETLYRYVDGNPSRATSLRVGHYPPSASGPTTNDSVKLRAIGVKTDNEGIETEFPVETTIAVADGSHGQLPRELIAAMLMMNVSVILQGIGVDDEASVTALVRQAFGVTDILEVTFA